MFDYEISYIRSAFSLEGETTGRFVECQTRTLDSTFPNKKWMLTFGFTQKKRTPHSKQIVDIVNKCFLKQSRNRSYPDPDPVWWAGGDLFFRSASILPLYGMLCVHWFPESQNIYQQWHIYSYSSVYPLFQQVRADCAPMLQSIKCVAGSVKEPLEEMISQPGLSMGTVRKTSFIALFKGAGKWQTTVSSKPNVTHNCLVKTDIPNVSYLWVDSW